MSMSSRAVALATATTTAAKKRPRASIALAGAGLCLGLVPGAAIAAPSTERVSVADDEAQADLGSVNTPMASDDGRYVGFNSNATNLVPGDTNGATDAFVRDRLTGATERVSVSSTGDEGNGTGTAGSNVRISADGRYVAFRSSSDNLVPGDTNGLRDIFVRDRTAGTTERVSVSTAGDEGNATSDTVFISADGRYACFSSFADNFVAGDVNGTRDIFLRDRVAGTTERVSVSAAGDEANADTDGCAISNDGRYVAFDSTADNLVAGDANGAEDVFVRDRTASTTERISVGPGGAEGDAGSNDGEISGDGTVVAFDSNATNLVTGDGNGTSDVFVRDRTAGTTERVSVDGAGVEGDGSSASPDIDDDGSVVVFRSAATNLVAGDANGLFDVFRRDRAAGRTERASVSTAGAEGDGDAAVATTVGSGSFIAFRSAATNLVADDTNGVDDIFLRDVTPPPPPGDPYADAVAPSSAAILNGSNALGAPDGRRATIIGLLGGHATFDMGAGEEGTGDLTVSYGGLTLQWTTTVSFLDGRGRTISSGPLTFAIGLGSFTAVVPFRGRTPYRYVRFSAGLLQKFGLDAVRAASIVP